jgi:hypothetical protein
MVPFLMLIRLCATQRRLSPLKDIVRGKFMCDSGAAMKKVVALLEGDKRIVQVLKFKNRTSHVGGLLADQQPALLVVWIGGREGAGARAAVHMRASFDGRHGAQRAVHFQPTIPLFITRVCCAS